MVKQAYNPWVHIKISVFPVQQLKEYSVSQTVRKSRNGVRLRKNDHRTAGKLEATIS